MSTYSSSTTILSTLVRTTLRRPFDPPSTLLCTKCHASLRPNNPLPYLQPSPQRKSFITTPHPLKKQGGKGASKNTVAVNAAKTANDSADPTDFSTLENEISKIVENLREEVRAIKPGGVNVEAVEDAKVVLKVMDRVDGSRKGTPKGRIRGPEREGGGGGVKVVVKVRDLCQVVPRGRTLVLMVGEKEVCISSRLRFASVALDLWGMLTTMDQHIKPITTAISAAPLSLTPQSPPASTTSSQQALEIHIPIPPTTGESRSNALKFVSQKGESALFALREARGVQKKRLRQLDLSGKIRPDLLRTAEKKLEKVNEGGVASVKQVVEEKKKRLGEG
ncbi:MAG: hypothetical protein Q9213_007430 [Squamulea squamosa]